MSPFAQEMFFTQTLPIIAAIVIIGIVVIVVCKKKRG